jgi:hypothetical protein
MAQRHGDDCDFITMLKEIGALKLRAVDPFRNEDGTEQCPFCDYSTASETALDNHIKYEHTAEENQSWLAFNGRTN